MAELEDGDLAALAAACRDIRTIDARRPIIAEGDEPEHVHLMVDGWAIRSKTLPNGSRQITAFLLPGDFCDLHVTILGEMDHDIQAVTQTKVAFIPHAVMQSLPEDRPALARAFRWATLVDEAVLRSWTVSMGRRDSLQRVSHLICELHARLELVELVEDDTFSLPVTQEVIADAVGLTPVHVNRTLMRLRYDGLIALAARSLTILDVPGLRKLAGFNLNYLHRSPLKRI